MPLVKVVYFEWPPCDGLRQLLATYPEATFEVVCPPFEEWHQMIFDDFALGVAGEFDLVVLDSQWIAEAIKGEHIVEVTDYWFNHSELLSDFYLDAFSAYTEFPIGYQRYYGAPLLADVMIFIYRKDILSQINVDDIESWHQLIAVAEAIQALQLPGIYPYLGFWCTNFTACYDTGATAWNQIAWSLGGEIWDETTYRIDGVLQHPLNELAINMTQRLIALGPPSAIDADFDAVTEALCNGSVAMASHWAALGPGITSPNCAYRDKLAFSIVPGETYHKLSLGGQGIHINAHTSAERQARAMDIFQWLQLDEQQKNWIRSGGVSSRKSILSTGLFLNSLPYAGVFVVSYPLVKDFWNLPEYLELLHIQMDFLHLAFNGTLSPAVALDQMAKAQQQIIDQAYPHGPPPRNLHYVPIDNAAIIGLLVAVGLTMLLLLAIGVWITLYRENLIIRFSSPYFMVIILIGLMMSQAALLTYAQSPLNDVACQFHVWLSILGIFLAVSPIIAKTWRVFKIWSGAAKLQRKMIRNTHLIFIILFLMVLPVVVMIVWTAVNPNQATRIDFSPSATDYQIKCQNPNIEIYVGILIAYLGTIGVSAAVLAFLTRNVHTEFNESRHLAFILYNGTVMGIVFLPLIFFLTDNPTANFLIEVGSIMAWTYLVLVMLFAPKLFRFYVGKEQREGNFISNPNSNSFNPNSNSIETPQALSEMTSTPIHTPS